MSKPTIAGAIVLAAHSLLTGSALLAGSALAGENQERETSTTVTAITSVELDTEQLTALGAIGLSDLAAGNFNGLSIRESASNQSALDLSIRGIGGTTSAQLTGESGVGVFVDGAYVARGMGLGVDLVDLESIEIQRGSQGVLSGRNTLGGAVHLTSVKPSGEYGLEQTVGFGFEHSEVRSITHVDLPQIANMLSARVSLLVDQHDGWVENEEGTTANDNYFGAKDNEGFRVAFQLNPSDALSFDYAYEDSESTSTHAYFQDADEVFTTGRADQTRSAIPIPETTVDIESHSFNASWAYSESIQVEMINSLREVESKEFSNFDDVLGSAVTPTVAIGDWQKQEQSYHELRVHTALFDGSVQLVGGVVYFHEEGDLDVYMASARTRGNTDTDSESIYAQLTWSLSDKLNVIAGVRGTSDEKTITSDQRNGTATNLSTEIEDENTDYSLAVTYDVTDSMSSFARYSTGFKSAGASLFSESLAPYDAETSDTIELGLEGDLFEGDLGYSAVVFTTYIDDRQLVFADPDDIRFANVLNDSGDTVVRGVELDLSYALRENITLSGEYTFLDTDVDATTLPYRFQAGGYEFDSAGEGVNVMPHVERAPVHSGTVAIDYAIGDFEAGNMALRVEYVAMGTHFIDAYSEQQESRDLINARLTMAGFELVDDQGTIDIVLWGNNLTDEEYASNHVAVFGSSTIPATATAYGEPLSVGVDVRFSH
jgi:iron complex outermembrane receptor protein